MRKIGPSLSCHRELRLVAIILIILKINRVGPQGEDVHTVTKLVMVTHNLDLECCADRILYVQDDVFSKQVPNEVQISIRD